VSRVLDDAERIAWLRLIRSDSIGPVTFRELLKLFGSASAALDRVPELARRSGRAIRIATAEQAESEIAGIEKLGARIVALGEPGYPPWLGAIDDAPPVVTLRGNSDAVGRPSVAVVGSRNASISGSRFAMQIAAGLGEAGFTVASGLARGIDAAAHRAALATGTAAVFAGGVDHPYPPESVPLAEEIVTRGGVLISEMPLGHPPRAKDFPRRNRIVSGISVAVVVVEGAVRSGTLITARRAAEQGRLVFAVPGSPLDPRSGATNLLIKEGASIVTSVDDVVSEVRPMLSGEAPPPPELAEPGKFDLAPDAAESERGAIVDAIGNTPVEIDEIIRFTGLKPATVRMTILELELAGQLEHHPGGRVSMVAG
jgi:DNA processing protein